MGATYANMQAFYKDRWSNGIAYTALAKSPLWVEMKKDTKFSERTKQTTVQLGGGGSTSGSFVTALASRGPGTTATFTITRKPLYTFRSIDNEILKSDNDAQIEDVVTRELELGGDEHGYTIQAWLWSNGGVLGQLAATGTFTGTTITVRTEEQARNLTPGKVIEVASDTGTGTSPAGVLPGTLVVASVSGKVITCTTTINSSVPGIAVSYYLFAAGTYGVSWPGLPGWIPYATPTDTFLGYNRALTTNMLAVSGFRTARTTTSGDKSAKVGDLAAEAFTFGVNGDRLYVNPLDLNSWVQEMGTKVLWTNVTSERLNVTFKGITVMTAAGEYTAVSDPRCPQGYFWGGDPENITLMSLGPVPMIPTRADFLPEQSADAKRLQITSYAATDVRDPSKWMVGAW